MKLRTSRSVSSSLDTCVLHITMLRNIGQASGDLRAAHSWRLLAHAWPLPCPMWSSLWPPLERKCRDSARTVEERLSYACQRLLTVGTPYLPDVEHGRMDNINSFWLTLHCSLAKDPNPLVLNTLLQPKMAWDGFLQDKAVHSAYCESYAPYALSSMVIPIGKLTLVVHTTNYSALVLNPPRSPQQSEVRHLRDGKDLLKSERNSVTKLTPNSWQAHIFNSDFLHRDNKLLGSFHDCFCWTRFERTCCACDESTTLRTVFPFAGRSWPHPSGELESQQVLLGKLERYIEDVGLGEHF